MLKSILYLSALVTLVTAQSTSVSIVSSATQSMPAAATQGFIASNVTRTQAAQWCRAQTNTCLDICTGRTARNQCDETMFTYSCICFNGTVPDCSAFQQTLPFYICQETYIQCINQHPSTDPEGQEQCRKNLQCGTRNATAERFGSGSASSSATSASGSATGSASATGATASTSRAAAAVVGPIANGAFVALLMALCKLVL